MPLKSSLGRWPRFRRWGGVSSFIPTDLVGLIGWYDFSDATTLYTDTARTTLVAVDGDALGGITDKSGTGNHATQATASKRATYKTKIQNGLSVARLDGVDDLLSANGIATTLTGSDKPFTMFEVCKLTDVSGFYDFASLTSTTTTTPVHELLAENTPRYESYRRDDGNATVDVLLGTPNTNWHLVLWVFGGTQVELFVDGVQVGSATAQNVGVMTVDRYTIGGLIRDTNPAPEQDQWKGDKGEHGVYDSALGAVARQSLVAYARTKWGTP